MSQGTNTNLQAVAEGLVGLSLIIKIIGGIAAALGTISILWGLASGIAWVALGFGLMFIGILIYVVGVFLAAIGEALLSLVSIEANISEMNQKIQSIPNSLQNDQSNATKFCVECNTSVESWAHVCPKCECENFSYAQISRQQVPSKMPLYKNCKKCETKLEPNAKFCENCGEKVE